MKFTDGNWLMRPGVRAAYPAQAYDIATSADSLTVYAPTRRIAHRGDTLAGPLLTIEFASPLADVVRVRLTHFAGQPPRPPHFELRAQAAVGVEVTHDDSAATLTSGRLAVRVARAEPWRVEFLGDGQPITASPARGMAAVEVEGAGH
jgi:alpha-D-xyloside xylohydrolase